MIIPDTIEEMWLCASFISLVLSVFLFVIMFTSELLIAMCAFFVVHTIVSLRYERSIGLI